MKCGILVVFFIVITSFFPFAFPQASQNENVTKQDIIQLQNKINELESAIQEDSEEIKKEVNDIVSSIDSLEQKFSTHDQGSMAAFAATWGISNLQLFTSIISGAAIAFLTMIISHLINDIRNRKVVKGFLQHDFEDVNERVVIVISNLRNTMRQIGPNDNIVTTLINHTTLPRVFMRQFLTGLLFFRWNTIVAKMSVLRQDQVEIISKLHGYVTAVDKLPQLDISLVSDIIQEILDSNRTEQEQRRQISQALNIDLETRLEHYDNVFHTMREDLMPIGWVELPEEHFR